MSHFSVLVIGADVEGQLEPYQEYNNGDCPQAYLEFEDKTLEFETEFENGSVGLVELANGERCNKYDGRFRRQGEGLLAYEYMYPADSQHIMVPFNGHYASFDAFVADYYGGAFDPQTQRYGYWHNPNAKWDWWMLGGRWTGYFKLKDGAQGQLGEPGVMTVPPQPGFADSAVIADIDFEYKRREAEACARKAYLEVNAVCGGLMAGLKTWPAIRGSGIPIDEASEAYNNQPAVKAFQQTSIGAGAWDIKVEDFLAPEETYCRLASEQAGVAFAVVMDGDWYQQGEMGWFGCVSDGLPQALWSRQF